MRHEKITSIHNPRVKAAVQLRKKRERDRLGLFLIEGTREIARALEGGLEVREVFYRPELARGDEAQSLHEQLAGRDIVLTEVSGRVFGKLAYRESSSCFVAVAEMGTQRLEDLPAGDHPLYLVVEAVEKPGNLGAILRTADAAGVTGLVLCDPVTDLYNPNVIRSSIGTAFTVPVAVAATEAAVAWLAERNIAIITSTPPGRTVYTEADMASPCAIVLGSEERGVSGTWLRAAASTVSIPMRGAADSLNVSATAAILLYEALRQRTLQP